MDIRLNSIIDKVSRLAAADGEFRHRLLMNIVPNDNLLYIIKSRVQYDEKFYKDLKRCLLNDESSEMKIDKIEKYLGLDYKTDGCKTMVDYGFVKEESVRHTLEADNREMLRVLYGTRYHRADFVGFCYFAHLQFELLLNYFYGSFGEKWKDKMIADLSSCPSTNSDWHKALEKSINEASDLNHVSYDDKRSVFKYGYNVSNQLDTCIYNIKMVRNNNSHRNGKSKSDLALWKNQLINKGVQFKGDYPKKGINYNEQIRGEIRRYNAELFQLREDYTSVLNSFNEYVQCIKSALSEHESKSE